MKFRIHAPIRRVYTAVLPVDNLDSALRIQRELEEGNEDTVDGYREEVDWEVLQVTPERLQQPVNASFDWEVLERWYCDVEVGDMSEALDRCNQLMEHFREHGSLPEWFEQGKQDFTEIAIGNVSSPYCEVYGGKA